jgi:hypothetical protein
MKMSLPLLLLFVFLSTSIFAAPCWDNTPGRINSVNRILQIAKHMLTNALGDGGQIIPPKP